MSSVTLRRIKRSLRGCRFKLSFGLCSFENDYCLDLFGFLICLPFLDRWHREPEELMDRWGVYYMERAIWFCWGNSTKCLHLPWEMTHIKTEVMRPDGTWVKEVPSYAPPALQPDGRWTETHEYRYCLRRSSWEVQHRLATIHVERMEWRQRWLKWCPYFAKKSQYIEIQFNEEVGERTGSWKGGCIGCSYELKPNETPLECLRRMEREREFT